MTYRQGLILALSATLMWSTTALVVRLIDSADVWAVLFWRSVGLLPVLFLWIAARNGGRLWPAFRQIGRTGLIGAVALVVAYTGAIYSYQNTSVANAVFLYAATPIFAALLARVVLHEAVRPVTIVAISLALTGILVMVGQGLGTGTMAGNIAAVLCALGFASFAVSLRANRTVDSTPTVALSGLLALGVAALASRATGGTLVLPPSDLGLAIGAGAVILAGGMILFIQGSRVLSAAEATLFTMVEVLLAPVWAWVFLGETASLATLAGGALLLAGVALNAVAGARGQRIAGLAPSPRPVNE